MKNVIEHLKNEMRLIESEIRDCKSGIEVNEQNIKDRLEEIEEFEEKLNEINETVYILIGIQNLRNGIKSKQNETRNSTDIKDNPPVSASEPSDKKQG